MKKIMLIMLCLAGSLGMAFAQDEVQETFEPQGWHWANRPSSLTISVGVPSMATWIAGACEEGEATYLGNYALRYDYNVLRWLSVGGRFAYEGYNFADASNIRHDLHRASVQMEVLFTYLNREHVQLYSGLCMGIGFFWALEDKAMVKSGLGAYSNYKFPLVGSVVPIGVRVGGDLVYGMAEVSVGYEAMMSLGIGFHF